MSEKDIQRLVDIFDKKLKEGPPTKEEALRSFMRAGILDEKGNFTKPYEHLTSLIPSEALS